MVARFRQISPFGGVDEGAGPTDAKIIVPRDGSSMVFLEGGADLHVASDKPSVVATPIKSLKGVSLPGVNVSSIEAALKSGAKRLFQVSAGHALVGEKGVAINAKNRKGTPEARLQAIVLKPKPMTVSLRQIQVYTDDTRKSMTILSQGAFDPAAMVDHMNLVYAHQANITWTLGKKDPVLVDAINLASGGPNRDSEAHNKALIAARDTGADLTIFFSRKAFDPQGSRTSAPWTFPVNGYTRAEFGFCVVADGHFDFTVEHEEGHFLGALDAGGKFVKDFGHSSVNDIMNVSGASNGIIPASMAIEFNKGF
jgi:hypothetical protein